MNTKNKTAISILIAVTVAFSILVAFSATASAGTINVNGSDLSCVGSGQIDPYSVVYCNIQDAIDDASAGDTIIVGPGTYLEWTGAVSAGCAVQIPWFAEGAGGLTIQSSDGPENTIIDCGSAGSGVKIVSNDITFDGFTVKNAYTAVGQVSGKGHTLSNLIITDFGTVGLELMAVHNCTFSDITIHGNKGLPYGTSGGTTLDGLVKGIDMQEYGSGGNTYNTFEDITIYDIKTTGDYGTSFGIYWESDNPDVHPTIGNTFTNLVIYDITGPWLGEGIRMLGQDERITIEDTTFSGGDIYDCSHTGINVYTGCKDLSISEFNRITTISVNQYCWGEEYCTSPCVNIDINCNNIVPDNIHPYGGVYDNNGDNDVDATNNWWNCPDGPYQVSGNPSASDAWKVSYDPWLTYNPLTSSLVYTGDTIVPYPNAVVLEATLSDSTLAGISGVDVDFYLDDVHVGSNTTDTNGVTSLNISTYPVDVYEVRVSVGCLEDIGFVAVYDPSAGFVTGGGWIYSEVGAYVPDPSAEGKAAFGFVSKYKKGQQTPTGNTEFQFKAGDLNFHSNSYDWLVIAGHKAMYKGTGTINGDGNYGFMLSAIDEKLTPSTDVDMFRIKIWDKDNGDEIVYDNQMGYLDDADLTTAIAGGQIVIHKTK